MRIRTKHQLITAALTTALVASTAAMVAGTQRKVLRSQAIQRLDAIMEGAARIAKESFDSRDRLMAISYLKFLQKEHPELAFASVSYGGHVLRLGEESGGLMYLERSAFPAGKPVRYTISAYPSASGAATGDLNVSTSGVSLSVSGRATVNVEEPPAGQGVSVRLGFVRKFIDDEVRRSLDPLMRWTFGIAGSFILLGLLLNAWVTRLLTGPIEMLAQATIMLAAGRLDVTVPVRTNDEMGALTRSFNSMAGRLKELVESREDILHTLTHEINTPLNGLKGYLELWQDNKLPQDAEQNRNIIGTMIVAVLRMETSLSNALSLFRSEHKALSGEAARPVQVDEVIAQTLTMFAPMAREKNIQVFPLHRSMTGRITAQEELIKQIVVNLVSNAIKYAPDGGELRLGLHDNPNELMFYVSNTGRGIPPEDIPHLFTKFYRSGADRASGRRIPGTGLGLNIVQRAVNSLGGWVYVTSKVGENTVFLVRLPKGATKAAEPGAGL
ncbi:MAG: HAMP domain-containing sensor histidine kinase [Elusimicrobiota bacterium]|nr:HAMP domain-containing sensor histidine kinase [Elusimicrobiota bacterium]